MSILFEYIRNFIMWCFERIAEQLLQKHHPINEQIRNFLVKFKNTLI